MTVPTFYQTNVRHIVVTGVSDVQTTLDTIKDEVLNQLPVGSRWSNLGLDKLKTPPDTGGRFMTVQLTRISATRLAFRVRNQNDTTILDGRFDISGTGDVVTVYSGDYHLFVVQGGEYGFALMLDPRPEALNAHAFYTLAKTYRDDTGAVFANSTNPTRWFGQNQTGVISDDERLQAIQGSTNYRTYSGEELSSGMVGSVIDANVPNNPKRGGFAFQLAAVSQLNSRGVLLQLPVDQGVIGEFEVLPILAAATDGGWRISVRRA